MGKRIAPKGSSEAFIRAHTNYDGDNCLMWPFRVRKTGYGLAVVGGVQTLASRWMCILAHGEPSDPRMEAAHFCGNPGCVNPRHLRWATAKENCADKLRHGTTTRGERSPRTRLTPEDVEEIRNAPPDLAALMKRFGVSKGCISKIRSGRRWPVSGVKFHEQEKAA